MIRLDCFLFAVYANFDDISYYIMTTGTQPAYCGYPITGNFFLKSNCVDHYSWYCTKKYIFGGVGMVIGYYVWLWIHSSKLEEHPL